MSLGLSINLDATTATYIDVRMERKQIVLKEYHDAIYSKIVKEFEIEEAVNFCSFPAFMV